MKPSILNSLINLSWNHSDLILFATLIVLFFTLIAIVWYSIETHVLRKWQQKGVQIAVLDLRQRLLMHADEMRSKGLSSDRNLYNEKVINIMNSILEQGKFDFKSLFAPGIIKDTPAKKPRE